MATRTIPADKGGSADEGRGAAPSSALSLMRYHQSSSTNTETRTQLTAVGVDVVGLQETHPQVVQHGGLVQVAESSEVVLAHQDVGVT